MLPPYRTDRMPPIDAPTDVPVLLLVSDDDESVRPPLVDGLEPFASDLERRTMRGGHWLARSEPTEVAAAVSAHIVRHAR